MAERRDDRSYSFDPVYRHLLRAMGLSQHNDVPQDMKAEINSSIELCQKPRLHLNNTPLEFIGLKSNHIQRH